VPRGAECSAFDPWPDLFMISARGSESAPADEPGIDVRAPRFASLAILPDPSTRVGQPRHCGQLVTLRPGLL